MAYSTPTMLRQALAPGPGDVPPTEPSYTAADLSDAQLSDAIAEADASIDTYIGGRYATPVAEVGGATPHPIDYWSRNIAAYNATLTFRQGQDFAETDPVARRYAATMLALVAVRDGKAVLPLPTNVVAGSARASSADPINTYDDPPLYSTDDFNMDRTKSSWLTESGPELPGVWVSRY